jgi:hypothetical protein
VRDFRRVIRCSGQRNSYEQEAGLSTALRFGRDDKFGVGAQECCDLSAALRFGRDDKFGVGAQECCDLSTALRFGRDDTVLEGWKRTVAHGAMPTLVAKRPRRRWGTPALVGLKADDTIDADRMLTLSTICCARACGVGA